VQTVLSVLTPFAAYLAAEHAGVSGILAVVVAGLYAGWNDFKTLDARTRNHAWEVWDMLLFAFNGLVFLLLGISLAHALAAFEPEHVARYLTYAFSLWAALTLLRLVWVYPAAYLPHWLSRRVREREGRRDAREVFLVGWAGLRGSVSMAAALSIPATLANGQPFPGRDLVVFLAATTIVLTLLLNGLSLPLLARTLAAPSGIERGRERRAAEIAIAQAGSAAIERAMRTLATPAEQAHARDLLASYRRRAERHAATAAQSNAVVDSEPLERRLSLLALEAVREALYALRDAGTINDQTLREIEARLDAADMYLAAALRTAG
jgi:CPA1 family monovalent cation:H+ antiporter